MAALKWYALVMEMAMATYGSRAGVLLGEGERCCLLFVVALLFVEIVLVGFGTPLFIPFPFVIKLIKTPSRSGPVPGQRLSVVHSKGTWGPTWHCRTLRTALDIEGTLDKLVRLKTQQQIYAPLCSTLI